MPKTCNPFVLIFLFAILFSSPVVAGSDIPDALKPWISWVKYGHEQETCTLLQGTGHQCLWSGPIYLEFGPHGGSFKQTLDMETPGWVPLPGSKALWPVDVKADGKPVTVLEQDDRPALYMDRPGTVTISGKFQWNRMPDHIGLPEEIPVIASLLVNGKTVEYPERDGSILWLRQRAMGKAGTRRDSLSVKVFRRIRDSVPMFIDTVIKLQVSGNSREIVLGWKTPADQIPFRIDADIPVRLNQDRCLVVKASPGRWKITYVTRIDRPVSRLNLGKPLEPWPDHEYWVFEAKPALRVVSVSGVPAVDPSLTGIPDEWKSLPAYLVRPGQTMTFKLRKRGDSQPRPDQLQVKRTFWLDQDGSGFSVQDRITGTVSRSWRIEAIPPMKPGRISLSGVDQLITRLAGSSAPGVELRRGQLDMTAESRIGTGGPIPVTGWKMDMKQVNVTLNLPPGWRLFYAEGADRATTWIARWTLLDVFLILILFFGAGRLHGWGRALAILAAMIILYHEPGTPVMIWLVLLATAALLRTSHHRFSRTVRRLHILAAICAIIMLVPFSVQQVRKAIYPQLELGRYSRMSSMEKPDAMQTWDAEKHTGQEGIMQKRKMISPGAQMEKLKGVSRYMPSPALSIRSQLAEELLKPDWQAKVQTGLGLPAWHWRTARLAWNGPVKASQKMKLWFISPMLNMILTLAGVAMLYLTAFILIKPGIGPGLKLSIPMHGKAIGAFLVLLLLAAVISSPAHAGDFPPGDILKELGSRVLLPPACSPNCASIESMQITIKPVRSFHMELQAGCAAQTAIPLPRSEDIHINHVAIDNKPEAPLLFLKDKDIYVRLPKGQHRVSISGRFRKDTLRLFFPLRPRHARIEAPGWQISGLDENNVPAAQIQIQRIRKNDARDKKSAAPTALPPFFSVKRVLHLGVEWRVSTTVSRLSPPGTPIILDIPLIKGEAVTTDGVKVKDGKVRCGLEPGMNEFSWDSMIKVQDKIDLAAPLTHQWVEIWELDAGYMWHVVLSGIPPVYQETSDRWLPRWRPWPGEKVTISVVRPEPVPGPTKTIDSSLLRIKPGMRMTEASLKIAVRSSRGDSLEILLPKGAKVQTVSRDGKGLSIKASSRKLAIPLHPGRQTLEVSWRQDKGITTGWFTAPPVNLGTKSVNNTIEISTEGRWLLFLSGPGTGPAMLYYSELLVFMAIAFLMGITGITRVKTWQWLLLALGLSQSGPLAAGIVAAWLVAIGLRERYKGNMPPVTFNIMQAALAAGTLVAFMALAYAIQNGLLGYPDMKIAGNGSINHLLRWYVDRIGPELPQPGIFSLPILYYRVVMLLWALWLSWSILGWLKWGWSAFTREGLWMPVKLSLRPNKKRNTGPEDK